MRRGSQLRATSYLLAAVALAIVLLSVGQSLRIEAVRGAAQTVFEPLQAVFAAAGDGLGGFFGSIASIGGAEDENRRLRQQVGDLQRRLDSLEALRATDAQLRASLELRDSLNIHTVAAEVIGTDPDGMAQTITIHAGSGRGLKVGMAVLGQRGLVGRIVAAQRSSSQVRLISDPALPVNVVTSTDHVGGTLKVSQAHLLMEIPGSPIDLKIPTGEVLVTSGLGGNFPKGIPVAEVVKFEYKPAEVIQSGEVAPLDDLAHLEYVLVDMDFVPELAG